MNKYKILYMAPITSEEQHQTMGPEDGQKMMQQWMAWYNKQGAAIIDPGVPLSSGMDYTTTTSAKLQAPYIVGYSVVEAADMNAAHKMISDHPHLTMPGASIQVLEMLPAPTSM
ncbi:MAG: hypothetical protein IH587_07160 [Anaerolineae bacterium]|nr:hypothetical protein [Anaerolineae bacterium]